MTASVQLLEKLKAFGVGRRGFEDPLFADDKPPPRLGVFDEDEESLCHDVIITRCHIPGCSVTADSLLEYENHYNACHRYSCSQCKKNLPSPHLLDLHIQEAHDSFFAVMTTRKASYCCYIEECKEKFQNPEERTEHCWKIHKIPKDFRFDKINTKSKKSKKKIDNNMEVDASSSYKSSDKQYKLTNSKCKAFPKYTGKKFTSDSKTEEVKTDVSIDEVMTELKNSLPE